MPGRFVNGMQSLAQVNATVRHTNALTVQRPLSAWHFVTPAPQCGTTMLSERLNRVGVCPSSADEQSALKPDPPSSEFGLFFCQSGPRPKTR
jgi:hypothetical protein